LAEAAAVSENRYPVYSLVQALDRLSPRARRKYDDLKALLADAEAMQRALMERITVKEERLANLVRQRSYAVDADEIERLGAELTAAHADLDKLDRERTRRNNVRANTEQTVSRLNNFIGELFSGASDITRPPWPDVVPGPAEGESVTDAILRTRHEISTAQGEATRVRVAPLPADEVRAALVAEVDRKAGDGAPRVSVDAGRVTVHWPDEQRYAAPGQAFSAPSGSASNLECWRDRDAMIAQLTAGLTDLRGAIPAAERPRLIREAEARILALEISEERLVMAALDTGLEVHRRIDASPWAILYSGAEEEPRAEAAE
jgi:hypothetical protein